MIFRKQLHSRDCFRTVIACLTELEPENVPDFMNETDGSLVTEELMKRIICWLQERGMDMISIAYPVKANTTPQGLMNYIQEMQGEDIIYLLVGQSIVETHVVICRGNKIIWDPSPVNSWVRGPVNGAFYIHYISHGFIRYNGPIPENQNPFQLGADDNEDKISV